MSRAYFHFATMLAAAVLTFNLLSIDRAAAQSDASQSGAAQGSGQEMGSASLCGAYHDDFLIGVAIDFTQINPLRPRELQIIKQNFNIVTPENSMKPQSIEPEENQWRWGMADTLVNFCQSNGIQISGHCLVWHNQTPDWFFQGDNGQPATRDQVIERMRDHIETEVGHFKGKMKGWDVVNEAIADSGSGDTENLRQTRWLKAIGPDYIELAFKFAHEADPGAELYYNDYNIERGAKHQSSMLLLKRLIQDGVAITAVGIQGHWSLNYLPFDDIDQAISDYQSLGLKVNISELDIAIEGKGGGQLTQSGGGASGRPTADQLDAQAKAYAKLFHLFQKHKGTIERVTFWGLNDSRSWRRGQAALLLDGDNKPKPAYWAVIAAKE
ncbi:MAG TPA: endo-1,4-beta-xylanase [Tepidisphaeraceae bacterium]|nr:endo-1,4-beta-xylanase [Tepidisphaeraceae bacterium]